MPTFRITGPDGRTYRVNAPDGATPEQALAYVQQQAGATQPKQSEVPDPVRVRINNRVAEQNAKLGPAAQGDGTVGGYLGAAAENALPAIGSGMTSVLRAVGGGRLAAAMGLPATKQEAEQIDAPLEAAPGGTTGRLLGQMALAAPSVLATPAALPAAVGVGAGVGALTTEGGLTDRAIGAAGGTLGTLGARVLPIIGRAVGGVTRGLLEPLTDAGRGRIAGRTIDRFSTQGDALDQLVTQRSVTGAQPTLPEAARDPGLQRLARVVGTMDPEAAAALAARNAENNAARVGTLQDIASGADTAQFGPPLTRGKAVSVRQANADANYGAAREAGADTGMSEALQPQIQQLLSRPEVQAAQETARNYARSAGLELGDNLNNVQGLQWLKQALDDQIAALPPKAGTARRLYSQTSQDLKSVLDDIAPGLRQADAEYAANSVPINRMDVGQRLLDKTTAAVRDMSGNPRLQANQFARALNDESTLVDKATGGYGGDTLEGLMSPGQTGRINAIRDELELLANLDAGAAGPGSHTAQMLAGQNLVRQAAGPLGLPESFIASSLGDTLGRVADFGYRVTSAQPRIASRIAEGLLDPQTGASLVRAARAYDAARLPRPSQLELLLQRAAPTAAGYLSGQQASQ